MFPQLVGSRLGLQVSGWSALGLRSQVSRLKFPFVDTTPITENQMEKQMEKKTENEMDTREYVGIIRFIVPLER